MPDVDAEVLAKARDTLEAMLLSKIEGDLVEPRESLHKPHCCIEISYSGTAVALTDGSDYEWDVVGSGSWHFWDLQTEQLVKDWVVAIPKTITKSTKKPKGACTGPKEIKDIVESKIKLVCEESTTLFENFVHDTHKDKLVAKKRSTVNFDVKIVVVFRMWACALGLVRFSEEFGPGVTVARSHAVLEPPRQSVSPDLGG